MSASTESTRPNKLSQKQIIEALRKEASNNPAFNAVAHVFAVRERARQQVTIASLRLRMAEEGFGHTKKEYGDVLRFLAFLGLGTLDASANGDVKALKNIKITLQSIGMAAITKSDKLDHFSPSIHFQSLPLVQPNEPLAQRTLPKAIVGQPAAPPRYPAALTAFIEGKPVLFNLSKGLTADELGDLLAKLHTPGGV